jgi:hypothetical protein
LPGGERRVESPLGIIGQVEPANRAPRIAQRRLNGVNPEDVDKAACCASPATFKASAAAVWGVSRRPWPASLHGESMSWRVVSVRERL